mmetsp:Transcript_82598/g.143506  ORF Transcript_82598/g.143506 Transcript_82598/m.143506 type:complete len:209 (+) Transcript_82598:3-629(+)
MMNINGLFQLGVVTKNACRHLACSPDWDWSWQVASSSSGRWEEYPDTISYCRYYGKVISPTSVEDCKISCLQKKGCNGVVTRHKHGQMMNCLFKKCSGTIYDLKKQPRNSPNVWSSYMYVKGPPAGSGSVRKALDFLLPYGLEEKRWADDYPKSVDEGVSWKTLALSLRIAADVYNKKSYEDAIAKVDPQGRFNYSMQTLLFPPKLGQ